MRSDGLAGATTELDITDIERQFDRLADVANGLPAANAGLPESGDVAANLLILRELKGCSRFPACRGTRTR